MPNHEKSILLRVFAVTHGVQVTMEGTPLRDHVFRKTAIVGNLAGCQKPYTK